MLEIFNENTLLKVKNSDNKIIVVDTVNKKVSIDDFGIDYPWEYEKSWILIEVKEYKNDYKFFLLFSFSIIILIFLIQIMFDSYFIEERLTSYLPKYIVDLIGGQITEVNIPLISFPLHVKIIGLGIVFSLLIYSIVQMFKKDKF